MKSVLKVLCGAAVFLLIIAVSVPDVHAITAWARKYGVNCNVCHVAGYKLTRTGQKFLREGHKLPGAEKEANLSDYLSMTAKIRTWGNKKVVKTFGTATETKESRSSFESHALALYSGGPLDSGFSYFTEMYLHENEKKNPLENNETTASDMGDWGRSKLAESYLQYLKPLGKPEDEMFVTARAGRIMPWLIHLHGGGARLEYSRPLAFTSTVGSVNPYRAFSRQYGASVGFGYKNAFAEAGLVNGTGKHENSVEIGTDTYKDMFASLDYAFGDTGMAGVYYYSGKYRSDWFSSTYKSADEFTQMGLFTNYVFDFKGAKGAFVGSYLKGNNKYDKTGTLGYKQKSEGYYAELQSHLRNGNLAPYFRWDYFDPDTAYTDNETSGPVLGLHYKPMDHGRFVLEYAQTRAKNRTATTAASNKTTNKNLTLEMQFMF